MWKALEIPPGNFGLVRYKSVTSEELKISFVEAPNCLNIQCSKTEASNCQLLYLP